MGSSKRIHVIALIVCTLMHLSWCVELPPASIDSWTASSFKIQWLSAPNPAYSIKQYEVTLESPPGTTTVGTPVRITASAGASRTFSNLDSATEYEVIVDAILQDDTSAGLNIHTSVWTLPHPPTNVVYHRVSDDTGTLTWTAAAPPIDEYELVVIPAGRPGEVHSIPKQATSIALPNLVAGLSYNLQFTSVVHTPNRAIMSEAAIVQIAVYTLTVTTITDSTLLLRWKFSPDVGIPENYRFTVVDALGLYSAKTYSWTLSELPGWLVIGLIPGTEYAVSVASISRGVTTTVASLSQSTRPRPPFRITLKQNNDGSLALGWSLPTHGNVDNIIIEYGPYGMDQSLQRVVLASDVVHYETPPIVDDTLQYTVKLYSSIGPNQELLSVEGNITATGNFSVDVIQSCRFRPCLNGGRCTATPSADYRCACRSGFTGLECEIVVIDSCDSYHCENGGHCVIVTHEDHSKTPECNCLPEFKGKRCERGIDDNSDGLILWVVVFSVLGTLFLVVVVFAIVTTFKKKGTDNTPSQLISPYSNRITPSVDQFLGHEWEPYTSVVLEDNV